MLIEVPRKSAYLFLSSPDSVLRMAFDERSPLIARVSKALVKLWVPEEIHVFQFEVVGNAWVLEGPRGSRLRVLCWA
jgi:frataxin-like iron-binding protein CyaY